MKKEHLLKQDFITGSYLQSFFVIKVNTSEDIQSLSRNVKCTFAHEYFHYLQDISTVYGLVNLTVNLRLIINLKHVILNEGDDILVPLIVDNYIATDYKCVNELFRLNSSEDGPIVIEEIEYNKIRSGECVDQKYVDIISETGKIFPFGACAILESQASILENKYSGKQISSPIIPYGMIKLITDHVYPKFEQHYGMDMIALSDVALNTFNPGFNYYDFLTDIKKAKIIPSSPRDIYSELLEYKVTFRRKDMNYRETFFELCDIVQSELSSLFDTSILTDAATWGKTIIDKVKKIRREDFPFIVSMIGKGDQRGEELSKLIEDVGIPLLKNNIGQYGFYDENLTSYKDLLYYPLLEQVRDILAEGKFCKCKLYDYCLATGSTKSKMGSYCESETWKSAQYLPCPFAVLWTEFGFSKKNIIKRNNG